MDVESKKTVVCDDGVIKKRKAEVFVFCKCFESEVRLVLAAMSSDACGKEQQINGCSYVRNTS